MPRTIERAARRRAPKLCHRAVVAMTGSIGAVWAARFVLDLRAENYVREVRVVMSAGATAFITPVAMRAISGAAVLTGLFEPDAPYPVSHVQIAEGADLVIVVPATANIIGKVANGIADDAVSATVLAAECPVVFVPNMNGRMWRRAAVQRNVRTLKRDGHHVVPPVEGVVVSSGQSDVGGMPALETIVAAGRSALTARRVASARAPAAGSRT